MPSVCVIIPCYNQGRFLAEAVESCLAQSAGEFSGELPFELEVLVVDDGSTDSTPDVCRAYADRVRVIRRANSGLPAAARNTGLAASRSDYVQFLDADDRILPGKIAEQVRVLEAEPNVGAVYSDGYLIDESGSRLGPANVNHPSGWVYHDLLTMWGTQVAAVLVRRSCVDAVGHFSTDPAIRGAEDLDLWLRLAARYEFRSIPSRRFEYRVGAPSVSADKLAMLRSGLEVLRRQRGVHGTCAACGRAIRAGRRRWKDVAAYGLMEQARRLAASGDWPAAGRKFAQVARHHPRHLARLASPRHLRTKLALLSRRADPAAPSHGTETA